MAHLGSGRGAGDGHLHPGVGEPPLEEPRGEHAHPVRRLLLLQPLLNLTRHRLPQRAG
jgi:hypothetical protein